MGQHRFIGKRGRTMGQHRFVRCEYKTVSHRNLKIILVVRIPPAFVVVVIVFIPR